MLSVLVGLSLQAFQLSVMQAEAQKKRARTVHPHTHGKSMLVLTPEDARRCVAPSAGWRHGDSGLKTRRYDHAESERSAAMMAACLPIDRDAGDAAGPRRRPTVRADPWQADTICGW